MQERLNEHSIKIAIERTKELINDVDEKYKDAAFHAVINLLLSEMITTATAHSEPIKVLSKKISIVELINQKKPKSHPEKTLVFAYYLERFKSMTAFNIDDIYNAYIEAKTATPKNCNDTINQCIRKGWIMESSDKKDDKKAFMLTNSGINYVESMSRGYDDAKET